MKNYQALLILISLLVVAQVVWFLTSKGII
jgi:hypothetical protein